MQPSSWVSDLLNYRFPLVPLGFALVSTVGLAVAWPELLI